MIHGDGRRRRRVQQRNIFNPSRPYLNRLIVVRRQIEGHLRFFCCPERSLGPVQMDSKFAHLLTCHGCYVSSNLPHCNATREQIQIPAAQEGLSIEDTHIHTDGNLHWHTGLDPFTTLLFSRISLCQWWMWLWVGKEGRNAVTLILLLCLVLIFFVGGFCAVNYSWAIQRMSWPSQISIRIIIIGQS